jgi:hypothetical protein
MKKASEYRQHAQECRELAKHMPVGGQRDQLLEMAGTWENLAEDRSNLVRRHPELASEGEYEEEERRTTIIRVGPAPGPQRATVQWVPGRAGRGRGYALFEAE